jgi:hypothetical protein
MANNAHSRSKWFIWSRTNALLDSSQEKMDESCLWKTCQLLLEGLESYLNLAAKRLRHHVPSELRTRSIRGGRSLQKVGGLVSISISLGGQSWPLLRTIPFKRNSPIALWSFRCQRRSSFPLSLVIIVTRAILCRWTRCRRHPSAPFGEQWR